MEFISLNIRAFTNYNDVDRKKEVDRLKMTMIMQEALVAEDVSQDKADKWVGRSGV